MALWLIHSSIWKADVLGVLPWNELGRTKAKNSLVKSLSTNRTSPVIIIRLRKSNLEVILSIDFDFYAEEAFIFAYSGFKR